MRGPARSKRDGEGPPGQDEAVLQARKDALERLLATTFEVRAALESEQDIGELLERRGEDCRRFAALCQDPHPAPSLDPGFQQLGEQILACQAECQSIMRSRLDSLASAIQESVQRRKVESTYGPACGHDTPLFLDKQQ